MVLPIFNFFNRRSRALSGKVMVIVLNSEQA